MNVVVHFMLFHLNDKLFQLNNQITRKVKVHIFIHDVRRFVDHFQNRLDELLATPKSPIQEFGKIFNKVIETFSSSSFSFRIKWLRINKTTKDKMRMKRGKVKEQPYKERSETTLQL